MPDLGNPIVVSPPALATLAAGIRAIGVELDATPDLVSDGESALGSAVVADALARFVSGWRDGRRQICTEVGALADMLAQASRIYAETESATCAAIPTVPS